MARPDFEDLPFGSRPDLTPYLVHLTKNSKAKDGCSAFENLVNILRKGKIWGSRPSGETFIKGRDRATCFMDVPFFSLKYVINKEDSDPDNPRYEPFSIFVRKDDAYHEGARPVLYLSDKELDSLNIPDTELWRVVRFEVDEDDKWISWLHEREWRIKGNFYLPKEPLGVLVKNTYYATELRQILEERKDSEFKSVPKTIIPLSVICQGLTYL